MQIDEFKQIFYVHVQSFLKEKIASYREYTKDSFIFEQIEYVKNIVAGGKCIRPYMAYIMYTSENPLQKVSDRVMEILVGIELFHTFCLIHDDVIDESSLRHTSKTIHTYVTDKMIEIHRRGDRLEHVGKSQAILIGDLVFSWVHELFRKASREPFIREAWNVFQKMIDEVVVGQMIDVDITTRKEASWQLIESKMRLKTAGYTFVRPMQIGVALAGTIERYNSFCQNFGESLGIGFQIQDDILDITALPKDIHKPTLLDLKEHQHTFLTQYIVENGTEEQKDTLYKYWEGDIPHKKREEVIAFFKKTGALDFAFQKASECFVKASHHVQENTKISEHTKNILLGLVSYIEQRSF